jgi:hypothetical protein
VDPAATLSSNEESSSSNSCHEMMG